MARARVSTARPRLAKSLGLPYSGQAKPYHRFEIQNNRKLGQRGENRVGRGVVSERFADVGKTIHVAGAEDKAAAKLKGILPEFVLMMTCGARAFAARGVILAKKMQKVC